MYVWLIGAVAVFYFCIMYKSLVTTYIVFGGKFQTIDRPYLSKPFSGLEQKLLQAIKVN